MSYSRKSAAAAADAMLDLALPRPARWLRMAIGGQPVVFLLTVSGPEADGPVEISASAEGATITIEPQPLTPGVVGEVS